MRVWSRWQCFLFQAKVVEDWFALFGRALLMALQSSSFLTDILIYALRYRKPWGTQSCKLHQAMGLCMLFFVFPLAWSSLPKVWTENNFVHCIFKPRSRRLGGFLLCLRFINLFFFLVLSVSRPKLPLGLLSSPDDVIISQLQAISQLFSSNPPSGAFCQVSKLTIQREHGRLWEMFIWSKLGQNPSDIHVGTFARIKNLIWDQLQATKAEIIQS